MTLQPSGIYCITNLSNGRKYVGQSQNIYIRRQQHFDELKRGHHKNKMMQADYTANPNCWHWEVLELCGLKELDEKESYWIKTLNSSQPNGYNQGWQSYGRKIQEPQEKHYKYKGYKKTS